MKRNILLKDGRSGLVHIRGYIVSFVLLLAVFSTFGQENRIPSTPGPLQVSEITANSVRLSWGTSSDLDGDAITYLVALRRRIEGAAQTWSQAVSAKTTNLVWDGLTPGSMYDVQIKATDGKATSTALIKESAFRTLSEILSNNTPSLPSSIQVTNVQATSALISWGASVDPDNDSITYSVSLRKRVSGVATEWTAARNARETSIAWTELMPETAYDIRVRASDGKSFSNWLIKENAFLTPRATNAPSIPTTMFVTNVTAKSAIIIWSPSAGPSGIKVVYELQIRKQTNGIPLEWQKAAETTNSFRTIDGLAAKTSYDVRIRAWASSAVSDWLVKENAFTTLAGEVVNHAPGAPEKFEFSSITPYGAKIAWKAATDLDGDALSYFISLRKRVEGVAQAWSADREAKETSIVWDDLSPATIYEVRVRAWDGKVYGSWLLQEHAFQTPSINTLSGFVQDANSAKTGDSTAIMVTWPNSTGLKTLETSTTLNGANWVKYQEIVTDGTNNRALVPIDSEIRFFRIK